MDGQVAPAVGKASGKRADLTAPPTPLVIPTLKCH